MKKKLSSTYTGFIALLVANGLFFIFFGYDTGSYNQRHKNFKQVEGMVLTSEVRDASRDYRGSPVSVFLPKITYFYYVDGIRYISKNMYLDFFNERNEAEGLISNYKPGYKIKIFYDPNNPKRSVLFRSMPDSAESCIMFGVFGIVFFISAALVFFKNKDEVLSELSKRFRLVK